MRSWLIAPVGNEEALAAIAAAGAHAVVLDLSRAASDDAQHQARRNARDWIAAQRRQVVAQRNFTRWVRIAGIDSPHWRDDLDAVMQAEPEGIIQGNVESIDHVRQLAALLQDLEQRRGMARGSTRIVPQLGGTPSSAFAIRDFCQPLHPRVSGLTWDAAVLARAIGARRTRSAGTQWSGAMVHVRAQVLLAAHAQGLDAIDSAFRDPRDAAGMKAAAQGARADGFTGMTAIHPAQVAIINAAFEPNSDERAEAQEIVGAFASSPTAETLPVRGQRLGQPQLARAKRLLGVG